MLLKWVLVKTLSFVALALTAGALACLAAVVSGGPIAPRRADIQPASVVPAPVVAQADDVAALAATILARPVFGPDRRPDRAEAASALAAAPAGLPRLTGILLNGTDRRAIFAPDSRAGRAQSAVLTVGGQIGVYQVVAISRASVTLAGPDGRSMVQPSFSDRPPTAPIAALSMPAYAVQVPPLRSDPARFLEPVGPLGIAMYRFSPAAPHDPPPVSAALTAP